MNLNVVKQMLRKEREKQNMRKAVCALIALAIAIPFCGFAWAEEYGIETKSLDARRIEWAIAMTADMAGNALDCEKDDAGGPEHDFLSAFAQVPYLDPDRAVVLEFTKEQAKTVTAALGIEGFYWENAAPALAEMINFQYSPEFARAAGMARAEGSSSLEYSRYFTLILLPYGSQLSAVSLTAYGSVNSGAAFIMSTKEINRNLGEKEIAAYISDLGVEMPLVRVYTKQELDDQIAEEGWGTGSDSFRQMADALLSSEERRAILLPAWIKSESPYLNSQMKYALTVSMLRKLETADQAALQEVAENWLPMLAENREETLTGILEEARAALNTRIAPPEMIYGDELHEAELKEDGTYLAVFEQSVPGEETVSWYDVILEAALPAERIPGNIADADYIIRFAIEYEGGVSNGDAHLHYPLTRITVHDARTGEMLRDLGANKRRLSGTIMISKGDTWWTPLYEDLWKYISVLFEKE